MLGSSWLVPHLLFLATPLLSLGLASPSAMGSACVLRSLSFLNDPILRGCGAGAGRSSIFSGGATGPSLWASDLSEELLLDLDWDLNGRKSSTSKPRDQAPNQTHLLDGCSSSSSTPILRLSSMISTDWTCSSSSSSSSSLGWGCGTETLMVAILASAWLKPGAGSVASTTLVMSLASAQDSYGRESEIRLARVDAERKTPRIVGANRIVASLTAAIRKGDVAGSFPTAAKNTRVFRSHLAPDFHPRPERCLEI